MDSLCFDLGQALERQGKILQEMLVAARTHNEVLRQNDVAALREIIGREEEIAARLKKEDRQRDQAHAALAQKLDLPADIPLSKLLPRLPQTHSAKLSRLAAELRNMAGEIAALVDLNRVLTHRAMHFNEQLLRLLKPIHNSTYQPDGKSTSPAGRSTLINKTV